MVPADELDDEQKHFLYNVLAEQTNQWISGFPGSGKSVLLLHILAHIRTQEPDASVLIIHYTHSLVEMYKTGLDELGIEIDRKIKFATYIQYEKIYPQKSEYVFDYILCDEVQDLTESVLELMQKYSRRLYVSGDPNQSIFPDNPQTREATIETNRIPVATNSTEYQLSTIHRLSKSVVNLISKLMPDLNILSSRRNAKKVDVTPRFGKFGKIQDEVGYVMRSAIETIEIDETVAIIFPAHDDIMLFADLYNEQQGESKWEQKKNRWGRIDYNDFNAFQASRKMHYVGNGYGGLKQADLDGSVILMTYHSSKGLDFDEVFLPFLNEDASIRTEAVFMVGLSRAKKTLTLTCTNSIHPFAKTIKDSCHDISSSTEPESDRKFFNELDDDIPF